MALVEHVFLGFPSPLPVTLRPWAFSVQCFLEVFRSFSWIEFLSNRTTVAMNKNCTSLYIIHKKMQLQLSVFRRFRQSPEITINPSQGHRPSAENSVDGLFTRPV